MTDQVITRYVAEKVMGLLTCDNSDGYYWQKTQHGRTNKIQEISFSPFANANCDRLVFKTVRDKWSLKDQWSFVSHLSSLREDRFTDNNATRPEEMNCEIGDYARAAYAVKKESEADDDGAS